MEEITNLLGSQQRLKHLSNEKTWTRISILQSGSRFSVTVCSGQCFSFCHFLKLHKINLRGCGPAGIHYPVGELKKAWGHFLCH